MMLRCHTQYKVKVNVSVYGAEFILFQGPCTITVINLSNKICNRNEITAHVQWVSLRHTKPALRDCQNKQTSKSRFSCNIKLH